MRGTSALSDAIPLRRRLVKCPIRHRPGRETGLMDETRIDEPAAQGDGRTADVPEAQEAERSLAGILGADVNQVAVQAATVGVLYGVKKAADKVREHGRGDQDTGPGAEPGAEGGISGGGDT